VAGECILVVDDNDMNVKLVRWLLEKHGYAVRTASDAKSARESVRAVRPQLVLMDIQLPDVDGRQLTREFKGQSGAEDRPDRGGHVLCDERRSPDEHRREMRRYITKPIDTQKFPLEIEKYLRGGSRSA